ncbi:DUF1266 domain-containing protein [Acidovorax sp. BL-A-41-H1]|uniref:DUF1266 domain-containing protein n=1 Tax=Acidovorax sp. BL-A-41-H1 TaxID=3421102 RepID=UPI003F79C038
MLQNHPGETESPVSNDWSPPQASLRLTGGERALAHGTFSLSLLTLGPAVIGTGIVSEAKGPFPAGWMIVGALALVGILCLAITALMLYKGATRRVKEQLTYYQISGISGRYPETHREALQLDGVNAVGNWSETLENWPCEVRMNRSLATFKSFSLCSVDEAKTALDEDWGVLTREGYDQTVRSLMEGLHTRQFLHESLSGHRQSMFQRLSALTGLAANDIEALVSSPTNAHSPTQLIWAWDWWRVIPLSRNAFMAGLIPEEVAWENILTVSSWTHALFDSLPAYHRNLRVGHAFWSNNYAMGQARKTVLDTFENSSLPIRKVKWRSIDSGLLPRYVLDGLAEERDDEHHGSHGLLN